MFASLSMQMFADRTIWNCWFFR